MLIRIAFSSYYYLNLDPENFLEYLVPKADEENNNEEDENHSDQDGRTPGERELEGSLMWSSASEQKCPEKLKLDGDRGGYRFTKMTFLHVFLQIPLLWSIMSHFI